MKTKSKKTPQTIGYRYWHYKSGPFFEAVLQQEKDHEAVNAAWFAFADRFGGVPAHHSTWGSTYISGVIFKEPPADWIYSATSSDGGRIYIPHGVKAKALRAEYKALPVKRSIAKNWGFEEATRDGRFLCNPACAVHGEAPNQIVYVRAYQSEKSNHKPPEGGTELLTWEWEKWLHDMDANS